MLEEILTIPLSVPSLNKVFRWHWAKKLRLRKTYQIYIRSAMNKLKYRKTKKKEAFELVITTTVKRKYDYDNLVGGAKILVDALVREGFIYDDSPLYVKTRYSQFTGSKEMTVIKRLK